MEPGGDRAVVARLRRQVQTWTLDYQMRLLSKKSIYSPSSSGPSYSAVTSGSRPVAPL
jgi:hypothetical protein